MADATTMPMNTSEMASSMMTMDMGDMDMTMQMYFFFSKDAVFFLKGWATKNVGTYLLSCMAIVLMGFCSEALKVWRKKVETDLKHEWAKLAQPGLLNTSKTGGSASLVLRLRVLRAAVTVLHVFVAYLLMLAFMTYNIGPCIAVLLGAFIGLLTFDNHFVGPKSGSHSDGYQEDPAGCH